MKGYPLGSILSIKAHVLPHKPNIHVPWRAGFFPLIMVQQPIEPWCGDASGAGDVGVDGAVLGIEVT